MKYKIEIKPSALKELDDIQRQQALKIKNKILTLEANPQPAGSNKLREMKTNTAFA